MKLTIAGSAEERGVIVPEVVVPGITTCGSSYCTSCCCVEIHL